MTGIIFREVMENGKHSPFWTYEDGETHEKLPVSEEYSPVFLAKGRDENRRVRAEKMYRSLGLCPVIKVMEIL